MIQRTLIDNSAPTGYNMDEVLKKCLQDPCIKNVEIATGYWDLRGTLLLYKELKSFLDKGDTTLRLLIGKDPYLYRSDTNDIKSYKMQGDSLLVEMNQFEASQEYVDVVDMLTTYLHKEDGSFQIRVYQPEDKAPEMNSQFMEDEQPYFDQFFHSKCYILRGKDSDGRNKAYGIIGSSNFTKKGLQGNSELNVLEVDSNHIVVINECVRDKTHLQWFNEKWNLGADWKEEFLLQVSKSKMAAKIPALIPKESNEAAPLTPYELYIKYLQMHFGDVADASTRKILESYLPPRYNSIDYQMEAVEQCFQILRTYNGFFLSDVVGLGKTIVGMLIIKKFIAEADLFSREPKVLIIAPPAIKPSWVETIEKFDETSDFKIANNIKIVTTGSIGSLVEEEVGEVDDDDVEDFEYDNYGLIIIDESHNFRNNETRKYKALTELIDRITLNGERPFVGLLSATPQNNSPRDLKNQIYLFELEPNKSAFMDVEGGKLDSFFVEKELRFKELRNEDTPEAREELKAIAKEIREKVLDHIVVRRTRTDIKKNYAKDAANLHFPTICGPKKLEYTMDAELAQLFSDTMTAILPATSDEPEDTKHIGYFRYQAINFFCNPDNKKLYEKRNLTVQSITRRLSKIMQVLLVKRLESSFAAFIESLENLLQYTQNMITMLKEDEVFVCPDVDVNQIFEKYDYDFAQVSAALHREIDCKRKNNRRFCAEDFSEDYLEKLYEDEQLIKSLLKRWYKNSFDPKKVAFESSLQSKLFDPTINNPKGIDAPRLVVFTEAKATQDELVRIARGMGHKVLSVNAENRKELYKVIKENFDALSDVKRDDFDIIVTTEVLAEGVNLHRANVILNYDTPWNATRLMQRIGRVNRIGSQEDFVHVFNFYPSVEGNEYIKLVQKAYAKLQAFHTMFGEDSKVYSELEEISEAEFNHDFEGEESPFSQYYADMKAYKAANPERFAYLKELDLDNIGGQFKDSDGSHRFIVRTKKHHGIPIIIDAEGNAATVSALGFMASLKTASNYEFATNIDEAKFNEMKEKAVRAYNLHVTHVINASDSNKRINDAKQLIKLIKQKITDPEARMALKAARKAVENGNEMAIRAINKCAEEYLGEEQPLFDEAENIDLYVKGMFSNIAEKAKRQNGEPCVAMYEL